MSPVMRINQRLDERQGKPHMFQTLIFVEEMEERKQKEFSRHLASQLQNEALDEIKQAAKQREKELAIKASSSKALKDTSKAGASSSKGKGNGEKKRDGMFHGLYTPMSFVLAKCKIIGVLGEGVTGDVKECDYDGLKVAVKVEDTYDYRHARDWFQHVQQEVKALEVLEELQGKVIPRVVIAGVERFFTAASMVLVTEKVGMGVSIRDDNVFVGEVKLGREGLIAMREKGLEGLKKTHAHGVVHWDPNLRNTRAELKIGKVNRVWWLDLGDAGEIDYKAGMVWSTFDPLLHMRYEDAMRFDFDHYNGQINSLST